MDTLLDIVGLLGALSWFAMGFVLVACMIGAIHHLWRTGHGSMAVLVAGVLAWNIGAAVWGQMS